MNFQIIFLLKQYIDLQGKINLMTFNRYSDKKKWIGHKFILSDDFVTLFQIYDKLNPSMYYE